MHVVEALFLSLAYTRTTSGYRNTARSGVRYEYTRGLGAGCSVYCHRQHRRSCVHLATRIVHLTFE